MRRDTEAIDLEQVRRRQQRIIRVLTALIVASLLLHFVELLAIIRTRLFIKEQITALTAEVAQARQEVFSAQFALDQAVPVRADVPIQQTLRVPISTTVTINDQVDVPLTTPLGDVTIPVPLNINVPVNTNVPVNISETVTISTTVDLNLDVPVRVPVSETSFADYLESLERYLTDLQSKI